MIKYKNLIIRNYLEDHNYIYKKKSFSYYVSKCYVYYCTILQFKNDIIIREHVASP